MTPQPPHDPVNSPSYQFAPDGSGLQAIEVIEAWALGFHLGNAVKYILRAGRKGDAAFSEDLKKARWYLDRELSR